MINKYTVPEFTVPEFTTNFSSIARKQWLRDPSEKIVANKDSTRSSHRFMNNLG